MTDKPQNPAAGVAAVSPSGPQDEPTPADFDALVLHIVRTLGGADWQDADDKTILEEADPWQIVRTAAAPAVPPEPTPVGAPFGYWEGTRIPRSCPAAESRRADSRAPAEADHIANPGKMMPAEVLEALKRDVLARIPNKYYGVWTTEMKKDIAALFDAAAKEPTK